MKLNIGARQAAVGLTVGGAILGGVAAAALPWNLADQKRTPGAGELVGLAGLGLSLAGVVMAVRGAKTVAQMTLMPLAAAVIPVAVAGAFALPRAQNGSLGANEAGNTERPMWLGNDYHVDSGTRPGDSYHYSRDSAGTR